MSTGKASRKKQQARRALHRITVGALPLIHSIAERMQVRQILSRYIRKHGNDLIDPVDTLLVIIYNLTLGKIPLYELDQWCGTIDLRRIGIHPSLKRALFNDDRFGKGLDKLYSADRASLMTEMVMFTVKEFGVALDQLHNDSTTVKAFGNIGGTTRTGLELKKGISKDHRPDLKQLVFNLSITADGGVPIHHRCLPGNHTDDKTHIETWKTLRAISGKTDFLYVGDSKLCTDEQLRFIVENGGRAITVMPETWKEAHRFKEELRIRVKPKRIIWRRLKPNSDYETEYFSVFTGNYTTKQGYRIQWVYSSEKKQRDRKCREQLLGKTEAALTKLNAKLNTRNLATKESIATAAADILSAHDTDRFIKFKIKTITHNYSEQVGKGRPSENTRYRTVKETAYVLSWFRNRSSLKREARLDGIFPLVSTDVNLSAKETLKAYKYQPRLEKRFAQFKSIHNAAPLLFKKIERVEANMFAFFISLVIQALLERQIRESMKDEEIEALYIYPEDRKCERPTSAIVFERFAQVSRYEIKYKGATVEQFRDNLNAPQKNILDMVKMSEESYWQN